MVVLCFVLALVLLAAALYLLWLDKQQKQRRAARKPLDDGGRRGPVRPAAPAPQQQQVQQQPEQAQAPAPQAFAQGQMPAQEYAPAQPQVQPREPQPQHQPQAQQAQPHATATPPAADVPRPPIRPAEPRPSMDEHVAQQPHRPEQSNLPEQPHPADDAASFNGGADTPREPASEQPKRGRLGRLLSGIGQGSKSRGASAAAGAAAAGAGAVGLGAAAMSRGDGDAATTGEPGDSAVMGDGYTNDANYAGSEQSDEGSLAAIQQQWLDARSFTEVPREASPIAGEPIDGLAAAQRVFTGTFRGCDSVITFAGPRTFVSLSRPGPATTAFIMERTSAADEGDADATVEQMNLRSDDPAADALLSDPRVVTALRGAPGEFQYCDVTEKWGHTSLPEEAISHYDGSIVTLHALVSAAAALPASGGAPLDLSSTDPGSAAAGRSEGGDADITPPRVVDAEEFDADIEDLGDDLEPAPVDPNAVPFEPRKPGRAGHLRLVKSANENGANDGGADESVENGNTADDGAGGAAAGLAAGAAGLAGTAGLASVAGSASESEDDANGVAEKDAASDVMGDGEAQALDLDESEIGEDATTEIEPDSFEAAMRSDSVPADRGDVAADFLPQRDPVPRPNRATSARFGDGDGMPALAEPSIGSHGGADDEFKPLGSTGEEPEESRESISEEVRRFETARTEAPEASASDPATTDPEATDPTDAGAEAESESQEPVETATPAATTPSASAFTPAARPAGSGGGRHRRVDDVDEEEDADVDASQDEDGTEAASDPQLPHVGGSALDPDFVETTRFRAPKFGGGSHRSDRSGDES
jgi:outer membrane biosynthesis protein TonB